MRLFENLFFVNILFIGEFLWFFFFLNLNEDNLCKYVFEG